MEDYNSSKTKSLVGDKENTLAFNSTIILTRKTKINAMKKEQNHID